MQHATRQINLQSVHTAPPATRPLPAAFLDRYLALCPVLCVIIKNSANYTCNDCDDSQLVGLRLPATLGGTILVTMPQKVLGKPATCVWFWIASAVPNGLLPFKIGTMVRLPLYPRAPLCATRKMTTPISHLTGDW